jgi:hypothetical protein
MFEEIGFFKEYWILGKYIGSKICNKDRATFGYYGKSTEVVEDSIVLDNGKKIRPGTLVSTMLFPLCGHLNKKIS